MAYGNGNGMRKAMPKKMKDSKEMKEKMDKKKKDGMKEKKDMKKVAKKGLTAGQKKLPKKLQEAILKKQNK